ncbi:hypothetical protein I302_100239 [Kwoniella bestiolae CBS 10118]|uniref:N-acetyltransferase domain-containing protein n=1 Tax=Kwoniella bestiolae CBS 10118 TaxID=1296100 RepID=A0A1B9G4G7_9TREE|nr:hypothetical protein I302_03613 [Kwoniella bestiolae CBS 10118]OCF25937.1 hypothetical protein I302_03613 [Kwoniella bestiolae CBS 10118]
MTFTLPGKSYDYQSFKDSCRSWVFKKLPSDVQSWGLNELVPKDKELKQSLEFDTEDAIEMTYIATKLEAQRQGFAECLVRELQALSRESGLPIWLVAHNPESVQMYHKLGFKETTRVNLDMGGGEMSEQTAFAYIPSSCAGQILATYMACETRVHLSYASLSAKATPPRGPRSDDREALQSENFLPELKGRNPRRWQSTISQMAEQTGKSEADTDDMNFDHVGGRA